MDVGTSVMPLSNTEPYALRGPDLLLSLAQVIGGSSHFHVNVCERGGLFLFSLLLEPLHHHSSV